MGQDIRQMLDAKRALLLAISHELRSPLTRARLNTELLPETPEVTPQRDALMRDLQEMASLISDLLESERLATQHAALNREPTDLGELARSVIDGLQTKHPQAVNVSLLAPADLAPVQVDCTRIRLLLRNLLDNALRHSADAAQAPELHLRAVAGGGVEIEVRDFGSGRARRPAGPHGRTVLPARFRAHPQRRWRGPGAVPVQAGGPCPWRHLCHPQCAAGLVGGGQTVGILIACHGGWGRFASH